MPRPAGPIDPGFRRAPAGLNDRIYDLWRTFPGKTGIAVQRIDGEWKLSQRGDELFPQQSVSKLWVALTVLDAIDQDRLTFDQRVRIGPENRSEEHTSELQSLMRISYAVFCLKKKKHKKQYADK